MSNDLITMFQAMKSEHERHRDRLVLWKNNGARLQSFPENETIDDMIERETRAVENIGMAIARLETLAKNAKSGPNSS